jgi:hypothetical protein
MNAQEFVDAVKEFVMDAAVSDTTAIVTAPPGRRPSKELVELSKWYTGLDPTARDMLRRLLEMATSQAIFGLFCALDGSRKIHTEDSHFELRVVARDGAQVLCGPDAPALHELM